MGVRVPLGGVQFSGEENMPGEGKALSPSSYKWCSPFEAQGLI